MNLAYHTWRDYRECPKKYFLKHRKRQAPLVPDNDYHKLYGKLTQKFFEIFCNNWRYTMPYMPPDEIRLKLRILYQDLLAVSNVSWNVPYAKNSQEDIFSQSFSDICAIMDSMNQNYFLGTRSEVNIEIALKAGINIAGTIDFIHQDPLSKGIMIFDGKGTGTLGKNVSDDQVLFYALLYYFHFKLVPEKLGFFYYKFNTFKPIPISLQLLNEFRARLSLNIKQILADTTFTATPSPKSCKYCGYQTGCGECIADRLTRKRPSRLDTDDLVGIVDIGSI